MANAKREERKPRVVEQDAFEKYVVDRKSVVKVTAGGRHNRWRILVVVGDKKGQIGYGIGKSKDPTIATEKATNAAKRNLVKVPIIDGTIPHEMLGKYNSTKVVMLPAKQGNGIIAGSAVRYVLELAGYTDITAKKHGSNNKLNMVLATIEGLKSLRTVEQIAELRGKTVEEILGGASNGNN